MRASPDPFQSTSARRTQDVNSSNGRMVWKRVRPVVGSPLLRMRIGDYRAIFEETADVITVTKVRPRGSTYD